MENGKVKGSNFKITVTKLYCSKQITAVHNEVLGSLQYKLLYHRCRKIIIYIFVLLCIMVRLS